MTRPKMVPGGKGGMYAKTPIAQYAVSINSSIPSTSLDADVVKMPLWFGLEVLLDLSSVTLDREKSTSIASWV